MKAYKKTKKTYLGLTSSQLIDRSGNELYRSTFSTVQMPNCKIVMIKQVCNDLVIFDELRVNILARVSL